MTSLPSDRQKAILEHLQQEGGVVISDFAKKLGVSEMTVRRDIVLLEEQGLARRVHGGAVALEQARFGDRLDKQKPGKARATAKLEKFIPAKGIIYLDGSTTMLNLVNKLSTARGLEVATNNVETFQKLSHLHGVEPVLIGGRLDRRTDNMVGALALRSILAIAFDAAFFSAWGLSEKLGPMEMTIEDAEVKDLVASRSRSVYVAVDESKLDRTASGVWCPDREKTVLATNLSPKDKRIKNYESKFATIL